MPGVFITQGMTVSIPAGGLTIGLDDQGQMQSSLTLHVHFDVCPTWVQLAIGHLKETSTRRDLRTAAWLADDEAAKASVLEREFESAIQAMIAAATAIEAMYATVSREVAIPQETRKRWREKRTARYTQVAETIRQGFSIPPGEFKRIRTNLKVIYKARDKAVHPEGTPQEPVTHPDLDVGVEWRFVYFRYDNAFHVVRATLELLWYLSQPRQLNTALDRYAASLQQRIAPLVEDWEQGFGKLA